MSSLDSLSTKGVTPIHIQLLKKFQVLQGETITNSEQIRGQKGRAPIPADSLVSVPHYLHNLVRGVYKPRGDNFALAIQLNPSSSWGTEINFFSNKKWLIRYDFQDSSKYAGDMQSLRNCHEQDVPIGVIYKMKKATNRILGLGQVEQIIGTKFTIAPFQLDKKSTIDIDDLAHSLATEEVAQGDFSSSGGNRSIVGRQKMRWFREQLMIQYEKKCAFCNLSFEPYLIGSHIVPFSYMQKHDPKNSMNPSDGILLCSLCDKAFERGDIVIHPDYKIDTSKVGKLLQEDRIAVAWLGKIKSTLNFSSIGKFPASKKYLKKKILLNSS